MGGPSGGVEAGRVSEGLKQLRLIFLNNILRMQHNGLRCGGLTAVKLQVKETEKGSGYLYFEYIYNHITALESN